MTLRLIDHPIEIAVEQYGNLKNKLVNQLLAHNSVLSIYQMGSVKHPGISDLDIICVFRKGSQCHKNFRLNLSLDEKNILTHGVFEGYKQEVANYQSVFDVCVFPSLNEPFGLVAVECLSKKKPVLVFKDGGGITEIINRFQPVDVCLDAKAMLNRLDYYKNNEFKWDNHFDKELDFFSLERMEQEYYNQYRDSNYGS